jgi:methyl-accepting chemotaxis protein
MLLVLFSVAGVVAWRNLEIVRSGSDDLALARIPQVDSATGVERNVFLMMYAVRGYALSEQETFRTQGDEHLSWAKAALSQLAVLTERFPQLGQSRGPSPEPRRN